MPLPRPSPSPSPSPPTRLIGPVPPPTACLSPPRKRARTHMGAGSRTIDGAATTTSLLRSTVVPNLASSHGKSRASQSARAVPGIARNRHWVFAYGTLKRGFPNAGLMAGCTYIGEFRTVVAYPLVVGGAYFSPYLLDIAGKGCRVKGEVYAVSDSTLATLDRFENVGTNFTRKVIKVASCTDRSFDANVFVYLKCNYTNDLLVQKYLSEYRVRSSSSRSSRPAASMAAQARNEAGSSMYNGRYSGGRSSGRR